MGTIARQGVDEGSRWRHHTVMQLAAAAVALSDAALQALDLRQHDAAHPRLGVVDHISCQPVGSNAQLSEAADMAHSIGAPPPPIF